MCLLTTTVNANIEDSEKVDEKQLFFQNSLDTLHIPPNTYYMYSYQYKHIPYSRKHHNH